MAEFQKLGDQLDESWSLMKELPALEEAWAQVAPNAENQRIEDEEEKEMLDDAEPFIPEDIPDIESEKTPGKDFTAYKTPPSFLFRERSKGHY